MARILVADDCEFIRNGLKRTLERIRDLRLHVRTVRGVEAVKEATRLTLSMVIFEPHLRDTDGFALLKELVCNQPRIPVLVYTDSQEHDMPLRVLQLGADGYLTKDCPSSYLVTAVRKILAGHKFITDAVAERLATHAQELSCFSIAEKLSRRERQIADLLVAGNSIKQIANALSLSQSTVSTYRGRILNKFSLNNTADLIRLACKNPAIFRATTPGV